MRISIPMPYRERATEFERSGSIPASIGLHSLDPLRLPSRCEAPGVLVANPSSGVSIACLALVLYEAGFLSESDSGCVDNLVKTGLDRVVERHLGKPMFVDEFALILSSTLEGLDAYPESCNADPSKYWIGLEMGNNFNLCIVGKKLLELESILPGLGQTVLYAVDYAGARTAGCWTPRSVRELAAYIYWQGVDTQEDWRGELELMGEDLEDNCGISPDSYDSAFPVTWATNTRRVIDGLSLTTALDHDDQGVAEIAERLCRVLVLIDAAAGFPGTMALDQEAIYRGCCVRWDDDDPIEQVIDDHVNYANQGCDGFTTFCSVWSVTPTKDGFAEWLKAYQQGLDLYQALDRLLELLDSPSVGESNGS